MWNETALRLLLTMNELLPIIRRKRRPLIVADALPVVVVAVEPALPKPELGNVQQPTSNIEPPTGDGRKSRDADTDY